MDSIGTSVTVVGLGLLGSPTARAFLRSDYELTVWNRSPSRVAAFEGSANIASSIAEACEASDVIIVCLIDPSASEAILRHPEVEAVMAGKVLVQLTTSTPAEARQEAEWANRCGIRYLEGAVLASPAIIGTDRAKALYSGPRHIFDRYLEVLHILTPNAVYCGEEIGRAAALDHALLELSYGCQAMVLHAMALCEAESVPVEDFSSHVNIFAEGVLERVTEGIGSGSYPSGSATMHTFASWAAQLVRVAEGAGVNVVLPAALLNGIRRTVALGHGGDDYQALYEAFRRPDTG